MPSETQPDWGAMAEKFDLWLPYIKPAGDALIRKLDPRSGESILDVASGTGEPVLTLAQQVDDLVITGTDAAQGMVDVAQQKADHLKLKNIHFSRMAAENLALDPNSFDKIMSRFGVMLFANPEQGLREMYRVLKPGGACSFTVWSTPESMTTMRWMYEVFKDKVPADKYPPLKIATSLSQPGLLNKLLKEIGFHSISIEELAFDYRFNSFDEYWNLLLASDIIKPQLDLINQETKAQVKHELNECAQTGITKNGLIIPHRYLLCYGKK